MKHIFLLLVIAIITFGSVGAAGVYAQTADKFYASGLTQLEAGQTDDAIRSFKKAIKERYKFPDAHNMLARAYIAKNNFQDRKKARFAIDHALGWEPENTTYLHTLAALLEAKYMHYDAEKTYERVLSVDSVNSDALQKLGEKHLFKYNRLENAVYTRSDFFLVDKNILGYSRGRIDNRRYQKVMLDDWEYNGPTIYTPFGGTGGYKFSPKKFSRKHRDKGLKYFDKLITINPKRKEAVLKKGYLLYQDAQFDNFIQLFTNNLSTFYNDPDIFLYLGLGYFEKGVHKKAIHYFDRALEQYPEEKRAIFGYADFFHPDFDFELWRETKKPQKLGDDTFWRKKDPMFLTEFNERKYAHLVRITIANLRYGHQEQGIEGWTTDKGRIYIRYGEPDRISDGASSGSNMKSVDFLYYKSFWYYNDYTFVFESKRMDYSHKSKLGTFMGVEFDEIDEEIFDFIPESYDLVPDELELNFPLDVVRFRGEEDRTDLTFFYGLPLNDITFHKNEEWSSGTVINGVFILDEEWNKISSAIDTTVVVIPSSAIDTTKKQLFSLSETAELVAGDYNFSIELYEPGSEKKGVVRREIKIPGFPPDSLSMSDILLAHSIKQIDPDSADPAEQLFTIGLNNLDIIPEPAHLFERAQTISLYYEIYNLWISPETDQSRYTVEYAIMPMRKKSLLDKIQWWKEVKPLLSVTDIFHGEGIVDKNILKVNLNIAEVGQYYIIVTATDQISGQQTVRGTIINLF